MRARANLAAAGMTRAQWRERWDAERLSLTADGERDKAWGNETIRWNADEGCGRREEIRAASPLSPREGRAARARYQKSSPPPVGAHGRQTTIRV